MSTPGAPPGVAPHSDRWTFLVLGGGGMIGYQIARQVARDLDPRRIVIASLLQREVRAALAALTRDFPKVHFVGFWGDLFLRTDWNRRDRQARITRARLLDDAELRAQLFADLFGDVEGAYEASLLVSLIREHRPEVIVDSVNTATAISYQDVYTASLLAQTEFEELASAIGGGAEGAATQPPLASARRALETLMISQSVPQLVRHVLMLHRAMTEVGTRLYLKIGTTGTGGMGLNIPYTHSEDKPSAKLLTKSAIAFAHTGLLFLMARTPGGPIVKEIKPGALVGYADVTYRTVQERGKAVPVYTPRPVKLDRQLVPRDDPAGYERHGRLQMVVVDTGENGVFTRGEFETITALQQMEFVTPEEIARQAVLEIRGSNTGYDVIAAIDGAVMNPSYRAGYLRYHALEELQQLEEKTETSSVALGQLGPPELGKLLWEAHLLKLCRGSLSAVLDSRGSEQALADELARIVHDRADVQRTITAIGLPVFLPDGRTLLRGPFIRIPEVTDATHVECRPADVESWATKGWVDLRPANVDRWMRRFAQMRREAQAVKGRGSAAITRTAYLSDAISIGAVVGWVFNNEMSGYRMK